MKAERPIAQDPPRTGVVLAAGGAVTAGGAAAAPDTSVAEGGEG
jgi:hypothetical protein